MRQVIISILVFFSTVTWAGFNFGGCSGSGTFQQVIEGYNGDYEKTIDVGEIPAGIQDLYVELISEEDVDIRLYGEYDDKIVHWPMGLLKGPTLRTKEYKDIPFTYSGYNGKDDKRGHEFIKVKGNTPSTLKMKAFGFKSGFATINYSWSGRENCTEASNGTDVFTQAIPKKNTALVGIIPANIMNLEINLTSNKDIDIQLFGADGTAIVSWKPIGLLAGSRMQTIEYNDMTIEWSGYNGVGGQNGHEYIKITGMTTELLTMKVYGYEEGFADVTYSWGIGDDLAHKYGIATQGDSKFNTLFDANNVLDGDDTTMNHTDNTSENWLEIEFVSEIKVNKIMIQGRNKYATRLSGAKVYVSNTPYSSNLNESDLVAYLSGIGTKQWIDLPSAKQGKYIIIKAKDGQYLHVVTVEVYGVAHAISCSSDADCGSGVCNTTAGENICVIGNVCGNGLIEDGEVCDDGNNNNDDSCTVTCEITTGSLGCTQDSDCASGYCNSSIAENRCEYINTCPSRALNEGESCLDNGEYKYSFKVKASNIMEKKRTANSALSSPLASTGLALEKGGTVNIVISGSHQDEYIELREGPWAGSKRHKLVEGENTIEVPEKTTLYFQTAKYDYNPVNPVNITLRARGISQYPLFKLNQTTDEEWKIMLRRKDTKILELETKRFIVTFNRDVIKDYEDQIDFNALGNTYDEMIQVVERAAGLVPNDPNPLHRPDENKYHFIGSPSHYMRTYSERITYLYSLTPRMIGKDEARTFWGLWHEVGHNLQARGLTWADQTEVSVNIFAVVSLFYNTPFEKVLDIYDAKYTTVFERLKTTESYALLNREDRELMYHHLFFIFGEKFYYDLHRYYREVINNPSIDPDFTIQSTEEQMNTMAIMVSKIRSKNMLPFFDLWKFPLTQATRDTIIALGYPEISDCERIPSELTEGRPSTDFDMRF